MSAQHTKGPWLAAARPSSVAGLPIVSRNNGRSIASVTFFHLGEAFTNHDKESAANARLIALAPELLEGVVEATDAIEGRISDLDHFLCCGGGAECGCRGSTRRELLVHDLRSLIARAHLSQETQR